MLTIEEFTYLIIVASLSNNYVLVQTLGVSHSIRLPYNTEVVHAIAVVTTSVMMISAGISHCFETIILGPLQLVYLRTLSFMLLIFTVIMFHKYFIKKYKVLTDKFFNVFFPLLFSNSAILGIALHNSQNVTSVFQAMSHGLGAGVGFSIVLISFANIREKITGPHIPLHLRGAPIALITIGLISMAFSGFRGIV
ncbi:MAG: hypothetical protein CBC09_02740 [Cellvibrionales bacterium TMED49]|nr:electron transport complex subunit RsxA [Porticoccaceae bacterium]OUU39310.1 MAG: hypothetical protein CBC09_02740 [Cellvibrionales bacterium TMED49]|tara:strand:+ start:702 stop:1286 length:585 start_codon:yes stop_codon:yes gene_type:complete